MKYDININLNAMAAGVCAYMYFKNIWLALLIMCFVPNNRRGNE